MISRSRSGPTAAAMSIECTTSANNTVTCLYSAGVVAVATAAPHSLQNFEFGGSSVPHDRHTKAAAVMSRRQPTVVHVNIVSPLAIQHVPYRRPLALRRTSGVGVRGRILPMCEAGVYLL